MFEQLASREVLRSPAAVASTENVDFTVADRRNGSTNVVVRVSGRTTGSLRVYLLGSFDGGQTYPATLADSGVISIARGVGYLRPSGPIPPDLRVQLVPSGGWDGQAGVLERTSGLLDFGYNAG